ncbi:right-handed parallel beta-helix repeat-containing protein [Streptacidiphilus neutrinimicus]|uniref:right-handed parallel beta-helix repeat-containing protein n=1 Tax=Streptacidiphilus neutrinimicus TaxID=105420 RepID=UPI0005A9B7C9|nr:right-handed parallel beta-helix repeat-containing protein [Streptacidiphilus neutrinimicus]
MAESSRSAEQPAAAPVHRPALGRFALALGLTMLVAFGAPAVACADGGHQYYLDCSAGHDTAAGTSPSTAWGTLAKADSVVFQPGDQLLIKRGTRCTGELTPHGSGKAGSPIRIDAYGSGAKPGIDGAGAPVAVELNNVQQWEVRNLDVTDTTTPDGKPRIGVYVLLSDYGTGHHYVLDNLSVHDITGTDATGPTNDDSAGILVKAAGNTTATTFDDVNVSGDTVSGTDGYGIATSSTWSYRTPYFTDGTNHYVPFTHVYIGWNTLTNSGGDGIAVQNLASPLIEHNTVSGFGLRATAFHAGVWAWNSDSPVMQYNNVSGGAASPPAMAFDIDGADTNVLYQYNYSHDNYGGFLAMCDVPGEQTIGATVRYNVSENDHDANYGGTPVAVISNGCGLTEPGISVYNNVVYAPTAGALLGNFGQTNVNYSNNIFVGKPGGSSFSDPVSTFSNNVYVNVGVAPSGDTHAVTTTAPGFVGAGTGPKGYQLSCGSPALKAGAVIAANGGKDYYGNPIPGSSPNIGVYQGACQSGS